MARFNPPTEYEFHESKAWGLLTSIDVHGCNPKTIRDAAAIKKFTKELCYRIKVKMFGETQVIEFGDDPRVHGYSMTQLIESSLVSGHFAEETNSVYLDVFSCKFYEANIIAEYAMRFFEGKYFNAHAILRGGIENASPELFKSARERKIILQSK